MICGKYLGMMMIEKKNPSYKQDKKKSRLILSFEHDLKYTYLDVRLL